MDYSITRKALLGLLIVSFSTCIGFSIAAFDSSTLGKAGLGLTAILCFALYSLFFHYKPVQAFTLSVCMPFVLISIFNMSLEKSVVIGFALCFVQFVMAIARLTKRSTFTVMKFEKSILLLVVLWIYSAFIGLVAQNDFGYWVGDSYRFLVIPFYYFLSVNIFQDREQIQTFVKFTFTALVLVTLVDIIDMSASGYSRDGSASSTYLILGSMALLYYRKKLQLSKMTILVVYSAVMISILHLMLSNTRTFYLGIIVAFLFFYLVLHFKNLRPIKVIKFFLASFVIAGATWFLVSSFQNNVGFSVIDNALYRLQVTYNNGQLDDSTSSRFIEARSAIEEMINTSVLVGKGFGSEYQNARIAADASNHFVHIKYAEILLRSGVIGLIIFLYLSLSVIFAFTRRSRMAGDPSDKAFIDFALVLHVALIVMSVGGMVLFIENHFYAACLGICGAIYRINERKAAN